MKPFPFLAVALAISAAFEPPWDWGDSDEQWASSTEFEPSKAICRKLRDREPPASDRPDPATARSLKGCDSEALYYGIGKPADPVRARQCAFVEAEGDEGGVFWGRTMLMTIYANGRGAKRDLEVAAHLACGIEGAAMESHGRVTRLAELEAKAWKGRDFHFCDDITSGLAMGHCARHFADVEKAKRESEMAERTRGWTMAEKRALAGLRRAHEAYVEAHGLGETDLSGTARGAMVVEAEERERDSFAALLASLSAGHLPPGGAPAYRAADLRLNAAYRQVIRDIAPSESPGAVTREGIRDAQRAWLRYRDAFLAFAAVKFPRVGRDGLAAWLTEQRTEVLAPVE
jgi:hypothetical protein